MADVLFQQSTGPQESSGGTNVSHPHPWLDPASNMIPNSLAQVLRWAEYIWMSQGTYRQACMRTARYFITDLMVKEQDDETADETKEIFENKLKIKQVLATLGDDFLCYGNCLLTLNIPFDRFLVCKCGFAVPFDKAHEQGLYEWTEYKFKKSPKGCPGCRSRGGRRSQDDCWSVNDKQSKNPEDIKLIRLNPHEIEIDYNPLNGRKTYTWNIGPQLSEGIRRGVAVVLRDTPMEIIEACQSHNRRFDFYEDAIFHYAEAAPAGFYTGGWGLPRVISNFRLAFHHQVLNRYDQAIAMDYINGMRVISPEQGTNGNGAGDPLIGMGGSMFNRAVTKMVATHKRDPNSWQVSGVPLKYQLFGGEGQQLSPKELMEFKLNEWLDATGVPAELYHGNLSVQAAPLAIRIFENSWPEIQALYNNVLEWVSGYMIQTLKMPEFTVQLLPPRLADDLERRQIMLQLMSGNQVSPQTAMAAFGIQDPREEIRRSFQWQRMAAEEEKNFNEEMQKLQDADLIKQEWSAKSQGLPPPGGDPAAGGGAPMDPAAMGAPQPGMGAEPNPEAMSTPESMMGEADRIAQSILQMGEGTPRRQALISLKKTNVTLHSLVKGKLEEYEQAASQQGVSMLRQGQMPPPQ